MLYLPSWGQEATTYQLSLLAFGPCSSREPLWVRVEVKATVWVKARVWVRDSARAWVRAKPAEPTAGTHAAVLCTCGKCAQARWSTPKGSS